MSFEFSSNRLLSHKMPLKTSFGRKNYLSKMWSEAVWSQSAPNFEWCQSAPLEGSIMPFFFWCGVEGGVGRSGVVLWGWGEGGLRVWWGWDRGWLGSSFLTFFEGTMDLTTGVNF